MAYSIGDLVDVTFSQIKSLESMLNTSNVFCTGLVDCFCDGKGRDVTTDSVGDCLYTILLSRGEKLGGLCESIAEFVGAEFLVSRVGKYRDGSFDVDRNHFILDADDVSVHNEGLNITGIDEVFRVSSSVLPDACIYAFYRTSDGWGVLACK